MQNCAAATPIAPAVGISHIANSISRMNGIDRTIVTAKQIRCAARIESVGDAHLRRMDARNGSPEGNVIACCLLQSSSSSHIIHARWSCHALNPTVESLMHDRIHVVDRQPAKSTKSSGHSSDSGKM